MLRELIARFTTPGTPPPGLSQVSQLSLSQRPGILLAKPSSVAKVATVAVAKVGNPKIGVTDQPTVECKGASVPGPETGLGWLPGPPADDGPDFDGWRGAFDLTDLCRLYGARIVRAGERILALFPPALEPELVGYASELLAEARDYLRQHVNKLPVLPPAEAVKIILDIMRQHRELRFCRGDGGSLWPLYPRQWTAEQKLTVQALWFAAGPALDGEAFETLETACPARQEER